jgi:hypothetical protein
MNRPAGCGVGLLLVAALAGCTPSPPADAPAGAAASAPPAAAATPDDPARGGTRHGTWARAEGERQGMPITWEYREDYSVAPPRRLPQLVVISQARDVPYVGQSDPTLQQEFTARERQLQAAFGDAAELVAVLDWHQQHDWFFYTDASVTQARVVAALGDLRGRDVRVTLENDAQEFYSTLKKRVDTQP